MSKVETTGIGSLPFPYVDQAIQHAFEYSIPFLPQLPMRDPRELALAQALDGYPGAHLRPGGFIAIDPLAEGEAKPGLFSPESSAALRGFLLELEERRPALAKLQIAGPITTLWASQSDPKTGGRVTDFLASRARTLLEAVRSRGVEPILFFDEPALFSIRSAAELAPLALLRRELRDFRLGLHCCSNARWGDVVSLGFDVLSIDSALSLSEVLDAFRSTETPPLLSLGIVPTNRMGTQFFPSDEGAPWADATAQELFRAFSSRGLAIPETLWLTPACGLGLQSVQNALATKDLLDAVAQRL